MTKGFDQYRQQICELYLIHGLSLKEVQREMQLTYNFDAQVRAYRYALARWGALKKDHHGAHDLISTQDQAAYVTDNATSIPIEEARSLASSLTQTLWSDAKLREASLAVPAPVPFPGNSTSDPLMFQHVRSLALASRGLPCSTSAAAGSSQVLSSSNHIPFIQQSGNFPGISATECFKSMGSWSFQMKSASG